MNDRRATWLCLALLALQPLLWLWPCVFGDRVFVPYDPAEFPPASLRLSPAELAAVKDGGNHDVTELPVWFLPELELARDELLAGRAPTWNPHARGGTPLHAHGLLGLGYPPNWLALFAADPAARLGLVAWLNLLIAGWLGFGLLRHVQLSPTAAWFGATLFQLGAPMATNAFFWMRLGSLAWLPGLWWALLCLRDGERTRPLPFAAVAVTLALPWLAGFPPFATTTTLLGGLLALRLLAERLGTDGARAARRLALRLGLAAALGVLLAMPQVLPSLLFFPQSARTPDPSLAQIATSRFDLYGLFGYLLPDAFGHPTAATELPYGGSPLPLWLCDRGPGSLPNYNYTEYAVFFSTAGLLLAAFGARRGRGHLRWFLLLLVALLVGLAVMAPGIAWLYHLPVVKNVWPMRWLVPAALPLAWLAAIGCDRLWRVERRSLGRLAAVALLLAAVVPFLASRPAAWTAADPDWLPRAIATRTGYPETAVRDHVQAGAPAGLDRFVAAGERAATSGYRAAAWLAGCGLVLALFAASRRDDRRRWLLQLLLGATVVELAWHGQPLLHGITRAVPVETPVHDFLRQAAAAAAADGGFTIARGATGEMLQVQLPPGQLLDPGIRDLHFYAHFDARSLAPVQRLLGGDFAARNCAKGYLTTALPDVRLHPMPGEEPPAERAFPHPLEHPLLDLLGVRYVLAIQPLQHAGARVGPTLRGPGGEFFLYERPHPLPRAFTVPRLQVLADDEAVLRAMVDPAFAPSAAALVTAAEAPADPPSAPAESRRAVRFVVDLPTRLELDVAAGAAPWLLLTDTWLPGWSATVDGQPVPLVRADHASRLLQIPPTACRVVFSYTAPGLALGLVAFGLGAAGLVGFGLRHRRRGPVTPS